MSDYRLSEDAIRAKVIELLDMCNANRMDIWALSGITAGVLDADVVTRVLVEEMGSRSHEVQMYWFGSCNCHGQMN